MPAMRRFLFSREQHLVVEAETRGEAEAKANDTEDGWEFYDIFLLEEIKGDEEGNGSPELNEGTKGGSR